MLDARMLGWSMTDGPMMTDDDQRMPAPSVMATKWLLRVAQL